MPRRKPPTEPDSGAWRVILEDIRAQIGTLSDGFEARYREFSHRLDEQRDEMRARFDVLEAAVRQNSTDIRRNSEDIRRNSEDIRRNSEDIRGLTARVEKLETIDERVSALEQKR